MTNGDFSEGRDDKLRMPYKTLQAAYDYLVAKLREDPELVAMLDKYVTSQVFEKEAENRTVFIDFKEPLDSANGSENRLRATDVSIGDEGEFIIGYLGDGTAFKPLFNQKTIDAGLVVFCPELPPFICAKDDMDNVNTREYLTRLRDSGLEPTYLKSHDVVRVVADLRAATPWVERTASINEFDIRPDSVQAP